MRMVHSFVRKHGLLLVVLALLLALAAPTLVVSYLPMTDYPQHLAIVSILRHFHDPAFGFDRWFEIDFGRTLYLLPYGLAWLLSHVVGVDGAMHIVAFASVLAYPLGLLCTMLALGRSPALALLSAPFVYNRAFYWGFINFNLSIGLSLCALAAFVRSDGRLFTRASALYTLAIAASVVTHVYGLALFLGVVALWALVGGHAEVRRRVRLLAVPAAGAAVWAVLERSAEGYDVPVDPPILQRLLTLGDALSGGFLDGSDNVLVFMGLALLLLLTLYPRKQERGSLELAIACACLGNLLLYFVLPQASATAKWIHFRHAFLAIALVPLLVMRTPSSRALTALPYALTLVVIANGWWHLARFEEEARNFDEVVARAPARARGIGMNLAPFSMVVKPEAYLHFIAYVQARKGGFVSMSFPQTFWNLPVKVRADAHVPPTPAGFEWEPGLWSEREFGWYYDWALIRAEKQRLVQSPEFPFERVYKTAPWQLYTRVRAR